METSWKDNRRPLQNYDSFYASGSGGLLMAYGFWIFAFGFLAFW